MRSLDDFKPLHEEAATYLRELPRLLAAGEAGRVLLAKGNAVGGVWDTVDDAYQAGIDRFGLGGPFLVQPVRERDLAKFADYIEPPIAVAERASSRESTRWTMAACS